MATLTPTLTLVSTDASTESMSLSVTDSLTTTNPANGVSRKSIGTSSAEVIIASTESAHMFTYLKNIDNTNIITVSTDGGTAFATLNPGEFMYLPVKGTVGLEVQANSAPCVLEYAFFARS
jgi:glutamine phosphoribosylpyrophosphate amidotransferase